MHAECEVSIFGRCSDIEKFAIFKSMSRDLDSALFDLVLYCLFSTPYNLCTR